MTQYGSGSVFKRFRVVTTNIRLAVTPVDFKSATLPPRTSVNRAIKIPILKAHSGSKLTEECSTGGQHYSTSQVALKPVVCGVVFIANLGPPFTCTLSSFELTSTL